MGYATLSVFMAISLLALDLDGTLLDSRGHISERNRLAIDSAREQGVRVALVTGRRFRDSRPVALELGLDVPLISHNGALTKHAATLQTVCVLPLPLAAAREALQVGRKAGAAFGTLSFGDAGVPALPGFTRPKAFKF